MTKNIPNELIKPETINFTELVHNSKTQFDLSDEYECKMINKLNETFTKEQQKWYIANLYMYMHYHATNDFPINLENVYKMVGFTKKGNAKRTLENNFLQGIDYKIIKKQLLPIEKLPKSGGSGILQEDIMLNTNTFKKFCMIIKTKKADEIREYYLKLEDIHNEIIKEEFEKMKFLIQKEKENTQKLLKENDNKNLLTLKLNRHNIFMEKLKKKKSVYLADIGNNFRKIGSTEDIDERYDGLLRTFGQCIFIDVFECENFREIETDILIDPVIKKNLYRKPNHKSREVVELSDKFVYEELLQIVKKHVNKFNISLSLETLEIKKINFLTYLISNNYTLNDIEKLSKLDFNFSDMEKIIHKEIKQDEKEKEIKQDEKEKEKDEKKKPSENIVVNKEIKVKIENKRANTRPINKLNPENLNIIKTYDSMTILLNEDKLANKYQLTSSIKTNKIYNNFRWCYKDDVILPTVKTKASTKVETILKINSNKTEILESYSTKKEVAYLLNISNKHASKIINNKELYKDFYYIKYSDCPEILTNNLTNIKKYSINGSKKIKQINPISKDEVVFVSLSEVCQLYGIQSRTLTQNIKNKTAYCGSLWEYVE
jgi:hypothetical protein